MSPQKSRSIGVGNAAGSRPSAKCLPSVPLCWPSRVCLWQIWWRTSSAQWERDWIGYRRRRDWCLERIRCWSIFHLPNLYGRITGFMCHFELFLGGLFRVMLSSLDCLDLIPTNFCKKGPYTTFALFAISCDNCYVLEPNPTLFCRRTGQSDITAELLIKSHRWTESIEFVFGSHFHRQDPFAVTFHFCFPFSFFLSSSALLSAPFSDKSSNLWSVCRRFKFSPF